MTCQAMLSWTFSELVGAFLDLAIAYFLLCGATLAYFASKFLDVFGLSLPCPCDGIFANPNFNNCFQRQLLNSPSEKTCSVHHSVRSKFPFDSIWANDSNAELNLNLANGNGKVSVGFEGEASCDLMNSQRSKEGRFDLKGKGVASQRTRHGLRRRKKGAIGSGKLSLVSSDDTSHSDAQVVINTPASVSIMGNEVPDVSLIPDYSGGEGSNDGKEASIDIGMLHSVSYACKSNLRLDEIIKRNAQGDVYDGSDKNTLRVLEEAFEEEHSARAALYLELEKERSAAATAADEAMAMILRLQKEKASVEMEARQYQRMIEEKSAYDAEEMNILKEILLRREREKHFLEKEVEAYRKMIFANEELVSDMHDTIDTQGKREVLLQSTDDPMVMLQQNNQIFSGIKRRNSGNNLSEFEVAPTGSRNCTLAFGKELPIPGLDGDIEYMRTGDIHKLADIGKDRVNLSITNNDIDQEIQEKGVVSVDDNLFDQEREVQRPEEYFQYHLSAPTQEFSVHEKSSVNTSEEQKQSDVTSPCLGLTSKRIGEFEENKIIGACNDKEKHREDSLSSVIDVDPFVHDVRVIDNQLNMHDQVSGNKGEEVPMNPTLKTGWTIDGLALGKLGKEIDMMRSSSDLSNILPPLGGSRSRVLLSDLRRNSMSAVDYERLKIDSEVGLLRERLKIVQEGREKLSCSAGHREKEKVGLQLLEDIASQIREIRQFTEPGNPVRQATLPPPSSKVLSKRRRWRSTSFNVHRST